MISNAVIEQDDFLSFLFGRNMAQNSINVILPTFLKSFEEEELSDTEAEYEDFLSFINDFQSRNKR